MGKVFRLVFAVAVLMLLAIGIDAAFEPWRDTYDPRAFRAIHGLVGTFADRPLGIDGLTFWLLVAGASAVLAMGANLATRRPRSIERPAAPARAAAATAAPTPRRRQVGHAPAVVESAPDPDEPIDFAALYALDRVVAPEPAWRLVETTPDRATAWLGGVPLVAPGFAWPRARDGRPMLFVAQIGLAGVADPRLPADGALLLFVGTSPTDGWEGQVRTVASADLPAAAPTEPPAGTITAAELGWHQAAGDRLQPTPLRLEAYLDTDTDHPVSKLFGVEVQDPHGFHYPDDFRTLLFIEHHPRLGTASGHWQGMAFACPRADLERGDFAAGRIFGMHTG